MPLLWKSNSIEKLTSCQQFKVSGKQLKTKILNKAQQARTNYLKLCLRAIDSRYMHGWILKIRNSAPSHANCFYLTE